MYTNTCILQFSKLKTMSRCNQAKELPLQFPRVTESNHHCLVVQNHRNSQSVCEVLTGPHISKGSVGHPALLFQVLVAVLIPWLVTPSLQHSVWAIAFCSLLSLLIKCLVLDLGSQISFLNAINLIGPVKASFPDMAIFRIFRDLHKDIDFWGLPFSPQ